ncbi:MAG: phospholipid carrier-dependent glycosyltransferase [Chloroflexi bacterium]|nr:MAG: hypothetical protein CUN54_06025 [Phototrophicales bacterium]RMF81478.1 MAG: phospholipid carrier-dependent glycosyltransferase [Chloroflexota bacterium]
MKWHNGRHIIAFIVLIAGIVIFVDEVRQFPFGDFDAWAIWNLRARALFRGAFVDAFPRAASHADYPFLLPLLVSSGWRFVGHETQTVPIIIAGFFTFGTGVVLYATLTLLRIWQAHLMLILLLGTPAFIHIGAKQLADVPLGFFNLLAVAALVIYLRHKKEMWLVGAGVATGFALWMKNEGALFAIAVALAFLPVLRHPRRIRLFLSGALPFVIALLIFKLTLAPPNDLVAGQGAATIDRITDLPRYATIIRAFFRDLRWYLAATILTMLFIHVRQPLRLWGWHRPVMMTTLLILAGYFVVFVTTPQPLQWHLDTAFNRLIMHFWPLTVFWLGLMLCPDELNLKYDHPSRSEALTNNGNHP